MNKTKEIENKNKEAVENLKQNLKKPIFEKENIGPFSIICQHCKSKDVKISFDEDGAIVECNKCGKFIYADEPDDFKDDVKMIRLLLKEVFFHM
jgi:ribosomal protein S27E